MELSGLRHRYVGDTVPDATWCDLTVAGVRCEAIIAGDGPPVVLMHGGLDSCVQWTPILATLASRFRCYVPERPSNGASDAFDYGGLRGDFRRHAAEVVTDMFDGLGLDRASLVGNSMGGLFSLAFATAEPDRVDRVVLVGVPAGHEDHALPSPVRSMAHPLGRHLVAWLSARATPRATRRTTEQLIMSHPDRCPRQLLEIATLTTRRNARAWRDFATRAVAGSSVRPDLRSSTWISELTAPTSYIVGSRDPFGAVQSLRDLAAGIGAEVTVIPDAGHLPWLDEPDLTADAILARLGVDVPQGRDRR